VGLGADGSTAVAGFERTRGPIWYCAVASATVRSAASAASTFRLIRLSSFMVVSPAASVSSHDQLAGRRTARARIRPTDAAGLTVEGVVVFVALEDLTARLTGGRHVDVSF